MALEPLIPYFTIPELTLLRAGASETFPDLALSIKPFGVLVALGAYVGSYLAIVHGKRRGFQERALMSFILCVLPGPSRQESTVLPLERKEYLNLRRMTLAAAPRYPCSPRL